VNDVFLDSVGMLAAWNASDQWHAAAESAYRQIVSQKRPIVSTTFVLLECGNSAARNPVLRSHVADLRRWLEQNQRLIVPTDADWVAAWAAYERGEAGNAGIVDHVSFSVMRRLSLTDAFTNDRHFAAAGFRTLF
jgi:predicted nucleic acid-binding protein